MVNFRSWPNAVFCISGQDWCLVLAGASTTHFAEDYVHQTVRRNLAAMLGHCLDPNESVRKAAHHLVGEHVFDGLGFVKELVADTMLSHMRDILSAKGETQVTWDRMERCMLHLEGLLRSLTKRQRQEWASVLVRLLHSLQSAAAPLRATRQKLMVHKLKLLWCADGDPKRTYAYEELQLQACSKSPNFEDVRQDLKLLLVCC